jgi:cobalamin biosynthesis Co2+ chelatase CbiK
MDRIQWMTLIKDTRMKMDWALPLHPYDESWRRKRKLLHSHVHQGAVDRYYPIQVASARRLARDIIAVDTTPEALSQLVRLNFVQTMIKAVYAIEVDSYDNEHISLSEKMLKDFSEAGIPGRFLVDFIPARE